MTRLNRWVYVLVWLLIVAAGGVLYLAGQISISDWLLLEACILALGVIGLIVWQKMTGPSESVEQLLYKTEHPKKPQ
jgi:hypothetical protein